MTLKLRTGLAAVALTLVTLASQPVLADGGWHHRGHHGYRQPGNWLPFALGAVVGGVAIGDLPPPPPVVAPPAYYPPPPVVVRPHAVMPAPVYAVPMPPPVYYTY